MILQYVPLIDATDADRVCAQVASTFIGCGSAVTQFEEAIAAESGVRHCIATTSGTTALMLAVWAVASPSLPRKILFPAYTFLAGANAACMAGFDVELVDIEPETLCMSSQSLKETLERTGPIAAVMFVDHNAYVGPKRQEIRQLCARFDVPLIEDCAQCFGVLKELVGDVGAFSFSVPKLVTTGQGGCVITNDDELAAKVRQLTDHGSDWRRTRVHSHLGGNFRFNDVLAALGLSQIDRLDHLRTLRKQMFDRYRARIPVMDHGMESAWRVMHRSRDAAGLVESLAAKGIQAVQYYRPIHHNPPYASDRTYPQAEAAYREWVYLPSSLSLTPAEISEVCDAIEAAPV